MNNLTDPSQNIVGSVYGSLVVTEYAGGSGVTSRWICRCECGRITHPIRKAELKNGKTKSCGCRRVTVSTTHGLSKSAEYRIWLGMKSRCRDASTAGYQNYGGRGITVCERWAKSFPDFLSDMGPKPGPDYSLDRIDGDGNYEPANCRWATREVQNNHRRDNVRYTCKGRDLTISQWSKVTGIKARTLFNRIESGMSFEDAISCPTVQPQILEHEGKRLTVEEWSKTVGFSPQAIRGRLKRGWTVSDALSVPLNASRPS